MTNLANLPQIPAGTSIAIASNADWSDQFYVPAPGFNVAPVSLVGALTAGQATFTVAAPGAVATTWLASGPGVPAGATVTGVGSGTITLSANATLTGQNFALTFTPPPLDLTGIVFTSEVRPSAVSPQILLSCSTALGTMTNGGPDGVFGWSVPSLTLMAAPWPPALVSQGTVSCVVDIIASDATGARVNLCEESGPIPLIINLSVTR